MADKVGVIGLGVVGQAVYDVLKEKGVDIIGHDHDIMKPSNPIEDLIDRDILFLCLPTPTKNGKQDLSSLKIVLDDLSLDGFKGTAVIKSTVLPGTTEYLQRATHFDLVHNPEFLSAKTAREDFLNQKYILIGAAKAEAGMKVSWFYSQHFPAANSIVSNSPAETEMAKYMCNISSAIKVGLFNEFYQMATKLGLSYEVCRKMAVRSVPWLPEMHTHVPGTDGQLGWGGMCFPKDVIAYLDLARHEGVPSEIINAALQENLTVRSEIHKML